MSDANSEKHNSKSVFQEFPEVRKQLWGGEFWSDGGYIGTLGDGVMTDTIAIMLKNREPLRRRKNYKQMNLLEFI